MSIKKHLITIIFVLVIEFLLGMITNIFVRFPDTGSETQLWEFAKSQLPIILHILVGLSLLVGSFTLVIRSLRQKDNSIKIATIIGLISIFIAGFAGSRFVSTQNDNYSFVMSFMFAAALLSYIWALYKTSSS